MNVSFCNSRHVEAFHTVWMTLSSLRSKILFLYVETRELEQTIKLIYIYIYSYFISHFDYINICNRASLYKIFDMIVIVDIFYGLIFANDKQAFELSREFSWRKFSDELWTFTITLQSGVVFTEKCFPEENALP